MTIEEAKIVLTNMMYTDSNGNLQLAGFAGGELIDMEGVYTAAELEAIAVWMRFKVGAIDKI